MSHTQWVITNYMSNDVISFTDSFDLHHDILWLSMTSLSPKTSYFRRNSWRFLELQVISDFLEWTFIMSVTRAFERAIIRKNLWKSCFSRNWLETGILWSFLTENLSFQIFRKFFPRFHRHIYWSFGVEKNDAVVRFWLSRLTQKLAKFVIPQKKSGLSVRFLTNELGISIISSQKSYT